MTCAEGISKHGFRRWYERQLIEGHVYLVTCLLSMIMVAASFEQIDWRGSVLGLLSGIGIIGSGALLCVVSVRRYSFLLFRAECLGAQSNCAQCKTYGVLKVTAAAGGDTATEEPLAERDNVWIRVRCKKCGHEWQMNNR